MLSGLAPKVFADGLWNPALGSRVGECFVNWAQSLFSRGLKEREGMLNCHLECHLMALGHAVQALYPHFTSLWA